MLVRSAVVPTALQVGIFIGKSHQKGIRKVLVRELGKLIILATTAPHRENWLQGREIGSAMRLNLNTGNLV